MLGDGNVARFRAASAAAGVLAAISVGIRRATSHGVAVHRYQDLIAWQLGDAFKLEVFRIVHGSVGAQRDYRFRSQLIEAARAVPADLIEGFLRFRPKEFARFLDFSIGSLGEAEGHLRDGVALRYFDDATCNDAFRLARRCLTASVRLKQSQRRFFTGDDR